MNKHGTVEVAGRRPPTSLIRSTTADRRVIGSPRRKPNPDQANVTAGPPITAGTGWLWLIAICGWLAALIYAVSTALGSIMVPGYSQLSDSVSELTISGAPARMFFVVTFSCYNIAVGALALGLFRSSRRTRATRLAAILFVAVAVAGVLMVTVLPQDPMGTKITVRGTGHIVTAGVAAFGLVAAAFLWASAWRSDPLWKPMSRWSRAAGIAILVTGAGGMIALATGATVFGLTERLTQLCFLSWFAALGTYAWRAVSHDRRSALLRRMETSRTDRSPRNLQPWLWLSIMAAVLGMIGNVIGLADWSAVYGRETQNFVDQALAQDAVNLVIIAPAVIITAMMAARGSLRAPLVWLGLLAFTSYNYVIYTMSVHVGPLYLLWIAVLGLSSFALIGGAIRLRPETYKQAAGDRPHLFAGWFQVVAGVLFAALWLRDIVPAIAAGRVPTSAAELDLPSSPVHVLDLALFLPAVILSGILLLRRTGPGYLTTSAALVFMIATGLPAVATPLLAAARGVPPVWDAVPPLALIMIIAGITLVRFLRRVRSSS